MRTRVYLGILILLAFVALLSLPAHAQFTTITATDIQAGDGSPLAAGSMCWLGTNNAGTPIGYRAGTSGQTITAPVCRDIVSGAVATTYKGVAKGALQVADTTLTNPANVCYKVTVTDTSTGKVVLGSYAGAKSGYDCVQPSGSTWSFDTYTPAGTPGTLVTSGPTGAAGVPTPSGDFLFTGNDSFSKPLNMDRTNLAAEYLLSEGRGTTLTDTSGAGHNATLPGSNAPTWIAGGSLSFASVGAGSTGNSVPLPATLNSARTITFAYTFGPFWNNTYALQQNNPTLLGASGATGPYLRLTVGLPGSTSNPKHAGLPSISSTSAHITYAYDFRGVGTHTVTYVLGTSGSSLDHIYIDGQEVGGGSAYSVQGASAGLLSSGNWILGGSTALSSPYFSGTIHGVWMWSDEKPAATVAANARAIRSYLEETRGISFQPKSWEGTLANSIRCMGDSITFGGANGATGWCQPTVMTPLNDTFSITNMGVSGFWAQDMIANMPARSNFGLKTSGKQLDIIWAGTNDTNGGRTAADAFNSIVAAVRADRAQGNNVMVIPMLSRISLDSSKNALDALLQQYWPTFTNAFCNVPADTRLGQDAAYANGTYFATVDKVHPTTAGNAIIGAQVANCVNEFFGSSATAWNKTTATTYAEAAADGYLIGDSTTNAVAITLPDCTGGYARPRYVKALGANGVTVAPFSGQQIDSSSLAVTVPAGGVTAFQPYTPSYSTAGCTWQVVQATGVNTTSTSTGTAVDINGSATLAATHLNASTPAAGAGMVNATVQKDASNNVSIEVPNPRPERVMAFCSGILPNSGTLPGSGTPVALFSAGQFSSVGCSISPATYAGRYIQTAGTVKNLCVIAGSAGLNANSLAVTIYKSNGSPLGGGVAQSVTVTLGTTAANTPVCDTTHSFSVAPGDTLQIRTFSQTGETGGNLNASYDIVTP